MSKRLNDLGNKNYDGMLDFMRDLQENGFTNELDNARVMKTISDKIEEILSRTERKGSYKIETEIRTSTAGVFELVVKVVSTHDTSIVTNMILFVRPDRDSLAVGRDVIGDEIKIGAADLPYGGVTVGWEKGKEIFQANTRFNKAMFATFAAVYNALVEHHENEDPGVTTDTPLEMRISPLASGIDVKYQLAGKKVATIKFEYNK